MRSVLVAACLAAGLIPLESAIGGAVSAETRNYSAPANFSKASVQTASSQTPSNCIREACGRLWCWKMK